MSVHSPTRFSEGGTWTNDGSLPPQWEELVDPETGKRYFVDHALKITSWVDPRDLFMKPEKFEECADGGFALGWERAVDPIDGEYFINHNTWTTTLKDPRLPPADRTRLPIQAHDLMDESIGPVSASTHNPPFTAGLAVAHVSAHLCPSRISRAPFPATPITVVIAFAPLIIGFIP